MRTILHRNSFFYLALFVASVLLFAPGQRQLPVTDRDEARFVQATRQMIQSGDYVVVRFQEELRAKKPAGIYWLQSASVKLFGDASQAQVWPYRLPSLLATIASVLLTFYFAHRLFNRTVAGLASIGLASTLLVGMEAHLATTDATQLFCAVVAQGCLALLYVAARERSRISPAVSLVFWIALGASILVKGPVVLAIVLLTMLALSVADRDRHWLLTLRPGLGVLLLLVMIGPWMWMVSRRTEGVFLSRAIHEDLLPKLMGGHEGHGAPPGSYVVALLLTFWPASVFLWPALFAAWQRRHTAAIRFLLAWSLMGWAMFELVPTKLPHYTLPLYPALLMLICAMLATSEDGTRDTLKSRASMVWYAVWSVFTLALALAVLWLPMRFGGGFSWRAISASVAMLACTALFWWSFRKSLPRTFVTIAACGAIAQISLIAGVLPILSDLWVSERIVEVRRTLAPIANIVAVGYSEPSLVFLGGTNTQLTSAAHAAELMKASGQTVALIEERDLATFVAALPASTVLTEKTVIRGFNYSGGKPVALHVFMHSPESRVALSKP
ncbi:MAG: ArnT family glycosyltransferase [Povalibacter sp.]